MHPRHIVGALALVFSSSAAAVNCPSPDNLVPNCGFDTGIQGYDAQVGDAIAYEPTLGSTADGAMRVLDTLEDANADAEAELCVDVSAQANYRIGADLLAEAANSCTMGWDEYLQPGCTQTNGIYRESAPIAVFPTQFRTYDALQQTSADVQSIELVIVCSADGSTPTRFIADDVFVLPGPLFIDGFEGP